MWRRVPIVVALMTVAPLGPAHPALAEPDPIPPTVPRPVGEPVLNKLDRYHQSASSYVVGFGEGMDGWLSNRFRDPDARAGGDSPPLVNREDSDSSQMTLSPFIYYRDGDDLKVSLQARGKLRLPRFSERLELVFDSDDNERTITPESSRAGDLGLRRKDDSTASLRYRLSDDWKFKPSIEAGLKFKPEPTPRLGLRLRVKRRFEWFDSRFTQSLFWERGEGLGSRSTLDLEQFEKERYLRKITTGLLWTEESDGAQGSLALQGFKYLSGRRAIGMKLGVNGPLEPSAHIDLYSAHLVWRQRLHRDWVFLEIEPGVDWPRDRDYDATPLVRIKLDIILGRFADPNGNGTGAR